MGYIEHLKSSMTDNVITKEVMSSQSLLLLL